MELTLASPSANQVIQVSANTFGREFNQALVHQVVIAYLAGTRAGTHAQKTRAEVSGGGAKPWKQKGSGRARAGTTRSPLWRHGGVTFAAQPQDYSQKINKKMYRGAMRAIFSELIRQARLIVVEAFTVSAPKTKEVIAKLKELNLDNVLIITEQLADNLYLATRNLPLVDVREVQHVDPASLIAYAKVLITLPALRRFEEILG